MKLLNSSEEMRNERREMEEEIDLEAGELKKGEIRKALRSMKLKKVVGVDGIPMEVWKYAGEELWKEVISLMKKI